MTESEIILKDINPVELLGVNDAKLTFIQKFFPKLKIIARNNILKVIGEDKVVEEFKNKIHSFEEYLKRYGEITEHNIEKLMKISNEEKITISDTNGDSILYGYGGNLIKARSPHQRMIVDKLAVNDMVLALGPAGTGKTYIAVALAVRALKEKEVKKIILTRPAVEAGENLGFLPGDLKEKLDPYLQPLFDALYEMIQPDKLIEYMEGGVIQIAPLAFMRGRTLNNAFVILDEAQNTTESQMKMFLTRMGRASKFLITGDMTQIDLPKNQNSGLVKVVPMLEKIKGIGIVHLDGSDVVRHMLVKEIIDAYEKEM